MNTINTLIVYDVNGTIIRSLPAEAAEAPTGVPYMIVDVPEGVIVKSIDVTTGVPVYDTENTYIPEINKLSAKMDYVAMLTGIDMSDVCNTLSGNIAKIVKDNPNVTRSNNFDKVYYYYMMDLWSARALSSAIGKWITQTEFNDIVKEKEASMEGLI